MTKEWTGPEQSDVRGFGPVYFFTSYTTRYRFIERGFVREIDPPYRWGKGVRVRLTKKCTLELGLCRRKHFKNEYEAVREALNARDVTDVSPPEIGDW